MKPYLIAAGILAVTHSSFVFSAPEIMSVEPNFIKMRHSADIKVTIKDYNPEQEISITPGGIFIENSDSFTSQANTLFDQPANCEFAAENRQSYQFTDSCVTVDNNNQLSLYLKQGDEYQETSQLTLNNKVHQVLRYDNYLFIANGHTGLTILEINENTLQWKSSYNKTGNITHIANERTDVLIADDEGRLSLIDITGPNRPLLISDFYLAKPIEKLNYKNQMALVKSGNELITINFESQTSPPISTLGVNQGGSRRSFIDGDNLYVADWFSGLHIYDISQPHKLALIANYKTPGSPKGVLVHNDIAYVADDDHGLQILDVSIPQSPRLLSHLPLSGLAYTMKLRGKTLYLASHYGGFHIIDVNEPSAPKLIGSVDTPGKPWALALKENELFVADDQNGLLVFDIQQPQKPVFKTQFNPGGFAEDIIIRDDRAYLAFFDLGLFILDIQDSSNIKVLSRIKTPGSARGIDIKGDRLYLASWEAGVTVLDITDETQPTVLSQFDTDGATWGLSAKNNYVYAMDWWGGVKVIDANNESQLRQITKYQTAGKIHDIKLNRNFLFTAHGFRGLQIYESSNPLNPVWASGIDLEGSALSLSVSDTVVAIAAGEGGMQLIDVRDPFQPRWLSSVRLSDSIVNIEMINDWAFALTEKGKLVPFNITQQQQPEQKQSLANNVKAIHAFKDQLWALNKEGTLSAYSLKNRFSKNIIFETQLPKHTSQFLMTDNGLFTTDDQHTLTKFQLKGTSLIKRDERSLKKPILDLHVHEDKLYVTTSDRKLHVYKNTEQLQAIAQYPSIHRINKIASKADSVFFSGESLIASGQLLPELTIDRVSDGFVVHTPKNMPLGTYHINVWDKANNRATRVNAFEIGFPKFKPKFTMEDLKRKMQEQNLKGKANVE